MISAQQVKELREITGAGMMDCKKALIEKNGNVEEAIEYLREKGISKAAKKSSRIAAEGLVEVAMSDDQKVGVVLEVNAETDFVAKNVEFKNFVKALAKLILEKMPKDVEELLVTKFEDGKTVQEVLTEKIATIGENMNIRRFEIVKANEGIVCVYNHGEGRIGVVVEINNNNPEVAKDMCLQVAAYKPEYLRFDLVPKDVVEKEREIQRQLVLNEGKTGDIVERIAEGKLRKALNEFCLENQGFIRDMKTTVLDYLTKNNSKVLRFVRYEKGEGLEKRVENFAEEVMGQLK